MVDAARHGWLAPVALVALAAGLALYWAAALALARAAGGGAAAFIAGLGLAEMARGRLLTGFPWAQPGHALIDTPLLHWAAWLGAPGLMALVLAASVALWHLIAGRASRGRWRSRGWQHSGRSARPSPPTPPPRPARRWCG